jgi:alpha-tubulin suppressor-like RCC1 family protein
MHRSLLLTISSCVVSSYVVACASSPPREASPAEVATTERAASTAAVAASAPAAVNPKAGGEARAAASGATSQAVVLTKLSTSEPDCGLDAQGRVWRWTSGHLERDAPSIKGAKAISCSATHTCVIAEDDGLMCWGENMYGALGDGTENKSETPVKVVGLSSVAEVIVDFARTCARTTNGDVYCWGDREYGKAGDGYLDDKARAKPLADKPLITGATSIGVGMIHGCATHADGTMTCWGQCRLGACGLPPRPPWIPKPMKAPKIRGALRVSAGEGATCAIDKDGGVSCWGTSRYGILGETVTSTKAHDTPAKINLPGPAAEVAVGVGGHACARLTTGAVLCWGHNEHGQLGDGTTMDRKAAAPVKGIAKATQIAAGKETTCALVEGGRLFCWGDKRVVKKPGGELEDAHEPVEITVASAKAPAK